MSAYFLAWNKLVVNDTQLMHIMFLVKNECLCFSGFLPSPGEFIEFHDDLKGIGK